MEELSPTITFKRSPPSIWFWDLEEVVWDKSRLSQPLPHSLESTNARRWSAENVTPSSQLRLLTAERESAVTGVISDQRRRLRDEPLWGSMRLASCILRCLSSHQEILQRRWFLKWEWTHICTSIWAAVRSLNESILIVVLKNFLFLKSIININVKCVYNLFFMNLTFQLMICVLNQSFKYRFTK